MAEAIASLPRTSFQISDPSQPATKCVLMPYLRPSKSHQAPFSLGSSRLFLGWGQHSCSPAYLLGWGRLRAAA